MWEKHPTRFKNWLAAHTYATMFFTDREGYSNFKIEEEEVGGACYIYYIRKKKV